MRWALIGKIALAIFTIAMLLQIGWLLYHWLSGASFGLGYWIWIGVLTFAVIVVVTLTLVFRKRLWPHDAVAAEKRALSRATHQQFIQARNRAKIINRASDHVPWNLFIAAHSDGTSTVMAELGYVIFGDPLEHTGLRFTTWTSPTAIAYRIEISPGMDLSFDLLDLVLKRLFENRPELAVNAAFVELELAAIMHPATAPGGEVATMNRILNMACDEFGLNIPVHLALVGLDKMHDLSRAALLTEQLSDSVILGGFLSNDSDSACDRVDTLFATLVKNFNEAQFPALQRQLLPDFCAALLNAPMQLALIQSQLRPRLSTLLQPLPPRSSPLDLQSLVFIGSRDGMAEVDPLSQVTGQRFFSNAPTLHGANNTSGSVTAENAGLLANAYHRESFMVAPNQRRYVARRSYAVLWSAVLLTIVGGYGYLTWENYRAYQSVNDEVREAFSTYFDQVGNITTDSDFLVQRTLLLQPIRQGLEGYAPLDKDRFRRLLPQVSLEELYTSLYHQELVHGFQDSLNSFMEKEIFAFNSLGDGVELIHLATIEAQLHTDQISHQSDLIEYFTNGLADQGEVSSTFQDSFKATMADLFALNEPRPDRNNSLRAVVAKTLTGLDTADLLYASIMRQTQYAERIDLRAMIGPRFSEVFVPLDDAEVYLVPRAYTRDGFDALFEEGEMPDLEAVLTGYESVIGPIEGAQRNAISRRVAQNYTGDYIQTWSDFASALELRKPEGWRDAQILMTALTQPAENPVEQLGEALSVNTDIKIFLPQPEPAEAPAPDATAAEAPVRQLAPASSSTEAATASNIRAAFRPYLNALQPGADEQSSFDLFLAYSRQVNSWLREVSSAEGGPGAMLLTQFQNPEQTNPLATLDAFVSRMELDVIRQFGQSILVTLDDAAMGFVREYIDAQWKEQIILPYGATLTQKFPFAAFSPGDIPLAEFTDLFGAEGKLRNFETTYLSGFRSADGSFVSRPTFLSNRRTDVNDTTRKAFTRFRQITEVMFVDGQPFLEFKLRPSYLSNGLSRLELSSGVTLMQYSHGPIRWSDQAWPHVGVQDSTIDLRLSRRSRALISESYPGPWSWFRLVQDGSGSLNPTLGVAEAVFSTEGGEAVLQFETTTRFSPFGPGFFSDIVLPQSLFDPEAQVLEPEAEISDGLALLSQWRDGSREAAITLIDQRGRTLDLFTRMAIQVHLQQDGFYRAEIDGIFGSATRTALFRWRDSQIDP